MGAPLSQATVHVNGHLKIYTTHSVRNIPMIRAPVPRRANLLSRAWDTTRASHECMVSFQERLCMHISVTPRRDQNRFS